ncbi:hypothetical protein [Nocardia sp. NPDC047654]|uniref:hypothetical protein n=1 Tax=Nocardia sp. NPDC047654 TaxID=3364314 RepID=UPI003717818E
MSEGEGVFGGHDCGLCIAGAADRYRVLIEFSVSAAYSVGSAASLISLATFEDETHVQDRVEIEIVPGRLDLICQIPIAHAAPPADPEFRDRAGEFVGVAALRVVERFDQSPAQRGGGLFIR